MVTLGLFDVSVVSGTGEVENRGERDSYGFGTSHTSLEAFTIYDDPRGRQSGDGEERAVSKYVEVEPGASYRFDFQIKSGFVYEDCACIMFDIFVDGNHKNGVLAQRGPVIDRIRRLGGWSTQWPCPNKPGMEFRKSIKKPKRGPQPVFLNQIRIEIRPWQSPTDTIKEGSFEWGEYIGRKRLAVFNFKCTTRERLQAVLPLQLRATRNPDAEDQHVSDQSSEYRPGSPSQSEARSTSPPGGIGSDQFWCRCCNLWISARRRVDHYQNHGQNPPPSFNETWRDRTEISPALGHQQTGRKRPREDPSAEAVSRARAALQHLDAESESPQAEGANGTDVHKRPRVQERAHDSADSLSKDGIVEEEEDDDDGFAPALETTPSLANERAYEEALREARAGKRRATSYQETDGSQNESFQQNNDDILRLMSVVQDRQPSTNPPAVNQDASESGASPSGPDHNSARPASVSSRTAPGDYTVTNGEAEEPLLRGSALANHIIAGYRRDEGDSVSQGFTKLGRRLKESENLDELQRIDRQQRANMLTYAARAFGELMDMPLPQDEHEREDVEADRGKKQGFIQQILELFVSDTWEDAAACLWQPNTLQNIHQLQTRLRNWIQVDGDSRTTSIQRSSIARLSV